MTKRTKPPGRPRRYDDRDVREMLQMIGLGFGVQAVAEVYGCSVTTVEQTLGRYLIEGDRC